MESHARVATERAARYMIQLAKHWSHKFEVRYDETSALFPLPLGTCRMTAHPDGLDISIEAADLEDLARLEDVVAKHLDRFAFREGELRYGWTRAWLAGGVDPSAIRINAVH
ncbi:MULTISPECIES: DUF2218 domain-containing protein [unclassified Caulobacter]|uniref:DUF2218 domain-containing protein n=1 Tax=unclassified Caulobacter TaxID=2648921 RepID=UPI0006F58624|nr:MULTISPECIES: DUF2218 domain-containing protein [unclassified Caulobacter]KQV62111.1 hypothetical protein ASC62_00825 [Caulobacter sp. Root342]KQV64677.1 hypothetical protein ASC70_18595 [Caulobacter sp. Root343]